MNITKNFPLNMCFVKTDRKEYNPYEKDIVVLNVFIGKQQAMGERHQYNYVYDELLMRPPGRILSSYDRPTMV